MEETYTNAIMEKGLENEPYARAEYESIFDTTIEQCGFITPDEDNKYHNWIGCSPDGLTEDDGLIEIKCPLMKTHLNYISAGVFPSEYLYQVQGQLFVTGLKYCDFMSYAEGMKPFIIRVFPEKALHERFGLRLDDLIKKVKTELTTYEQFDYYR